MPTQPNTTNTMASHSAPSPRALQPSAERCVRVVNATGLHLRAAAEIVRALRPFQADITLDHLGARADARSIMSLICLAVPAGAMVLVRATGRDALPAMAAVAALFASGFGEGGEVVEPDETHPWQSGPSADADETDGVGRALQVQGC